MECMSPNASGWEIAAAAAIAVALGQWLRKPLKGIREKRIGYRAGAALARIARRITARTRRP